MDRPIPSVGQRAAAAPPASLYVHIPFCRAKCAYCDFSSYAGLEALFDRYVDAVIHEMDGAGLELLKTVYVGGGTPTVLPDRLLAQILEHVQRHCIPLDNGGIRAEVTLEANPGTVDPRGLKRLKGLGVTRLSLGIQSFDEHELEMLGRIHSAPEAVAAFRAARQAGFDDVNVDLIYGLPRQTVATWRSTLEAALALEPEHLSAYALSVEEGTPLAAAIDHGVLPRPDPDWAAEMYELAEERLEQAGYLHYEISNWARDPGHRCRHNLTYWRNEPYRGVGAAAHSWDGRRRWSNVATPAAYAAEMLAGRSPVGAQEEISAELETAETMIMGLRLVAYGVERERFRERFGVDMAERYGPELDELVEMGLVVADDERVRLTVRGRLLGNQVFVRFLPD